MDQDKAIDKIKKCLALAASSNPHEAAVAMRQAQKLMAEHGIDGLDLQLSDIEENSAKVHSNALPSWEVTLGRMVAEAFACTWLVDHKFLSGRFVKMYTFIGINIHSKTASYAFEVLSRQCAKDRAAYVKKLPKRLKSSTRTAKGDAFALGWASSVRSLLARFAGNEKQEALLLAYMERNYPNLGKAKTRTRELSRYVRDDNFQDGAIAGRRAQLNRAVGSPEATKLITG